MAHKIEIGQKYILNQFVAGLGAKGKTFIFPDDYPDRKMLQYYLRTGEVSFVEEVSVSDTVEEHPRKKSTKRPIENDDLVDAMPN